MDLGLLEINEAAEIVQGAADPDANIIFGAVIDESLKDEIRITVIATGFENERILQNKAALKSKEKENHIEKEPVKATEEVAYTKEYDTSDLEIPAFLRRKSK